ncbi:glycosyltransferase [Calothrix sp. FACHB-1219]|uniref:glycosyltransferase n=1 Tax=unclassified Calothrix TaxID=2619626 RepID=UPI001682DB8B|nr:MULTISPECIES: glycosyltransferase [unclassified Calothrix]MBD2201307.1 glycosyltransferase [Calothrix sp. FACHB-168]MBD2215741.1 glycosyltransferase [Calothrix sp. FACHB-1219]
MSSVDLSIIVASYSTENLTRGCLKSIYENTHGISFEVIVVDDCSKDNSPNMVEREFPQARLICNPVNMRYAKTNNIGLKAAKGRYGLLLNSDVELRGDAFTALVKFMDTHQDVAAAGPKLINPDGSIQHCIRSFAGLMPMLAQSVNMHQWWPNNPFTDLYYNTKFDYEKSQQVQSIGTTAFIIRRSTWETYGMLDERFTLSMVDLAYCRMLGQGNQKIYYVADAVVMHYGSASINQSSLKEIRLTHAALRQFYDIYYAPNHNPFVQVLAIIGIWLRKQFKILEYYLSTDKRVIKGPGAPPKAAT